MKIRRSIMGSIAVLCAVPAAIGCAVLLGGDKAGKAIPAAVITDLNEPPVIILDAGHGASTKVGSYNSFASI